MKSKRKFKKGDVILWYFYHKPNEKFLGKFNSYIKKDLLDCYVTSIDGADIQMNSRDLIRILPNIGALFIESSEDQ